MDEAVRQRLKKLRDAAARCRRLAAGAVPLEVAEELCAIAAEYDGEIAELTVKADLRRARWG